MKSTPAPPAPLRILYVDDNPMQLEAARLALVEDGHDVQVAMELVTAARVVAEMDVVILDFHMPGVDCAEALGRFRKRLPQGARTRFYLYTNDVNVAVQYKDFGFDGAFARKGSVDDLVSQVRTVARLIRMRSVVSRQ